VNVGVEDLGSIRQLAAKLFVVLHEQLQRPLQSLLHREESMEHVDASGRSTAALGLAA
jgi:hypothetical protein